MDSPLEARIDTLEAGCQSRTEPERGQMAPLTRVCSLGAKLALARLDV